MSIGSYQLKIGFKSDLVYNLIVDYRIGFKSTKIELELDLWTDLYLLICESFDPITGYGTCKYKELDKSNTEQEDPFLTLR